MTDWHCLRCRHRVRIDWHANFVLCPVCDEHMRRGQGRGTTINARIQASMRTARAVRLEAEREQA